MNCTESEWDALLSERDALKLKAADRDEWQQVAMNVSEERDALRAKLNAAERACPEMIPPPTTPDLQAEHSFSEHLQKVINDLESERDALRAKLGASERAAAEMRRRLTEARNWIVGDASRLALETLPELDAALSSDAGRDYVPRSEVDEAWCDALNACRLCASGYNTEYDKGYLDARSTIERRLVAARDAKKAAQ